MNRRQFVAALPMAAVAVAIDSAPAETRTVFDAAVMSEDERRRTSVWLDGVLVAGTGVGADWRGRGVFYADTKNGLIRCYKQWPDGKRRDPDTGSLAIESRGGKVEVRIAAQ